MGVYMNQRLHVRQTPEDDGAGQYGCGISGWRLTMYWGHRSADFGHFENFCEDSDRRDADLMLYAQQHPLITWVGPPMIHVRNSIAAYWSDPPIGNEPVPDDLDFT
jgi:hypothetical protein